MKEEGPMSDALAGLVARYEKLSTPMVYDILDRMGFPGQALAAEVRPLEATMSVAEAEVSTGVVKSVRGL